MAPYPQSKRERLNYLEFKVFFTGQISRADLMNRFGISEAAATRDLTLYRAQAPANLEFDPAGKTYRMGAAFSPKYLKEIDSSRLLHALVHGTGNEFGSTPESWISCEFPVRLSVPSAEILAAVSRAIYQKAVLQIEYLSGSGNHGAREIVPFSLAGTGLKWMVRAYCRRKRLFSDFILSRIRDAKVLPYLKPRSDELKENDDEWNRMVKLELIPHPTASDDKKALTIQEFGMVEGVHILRVRAALAGYVLRLWNVDCSENLSEPLCSLALRNKLSLHDIDSAILAPGYKRDKAGDQ